MVEGQKRRHGFSVLAPVGLCLAVASVLFQELFEKPRATGFGDYQFFHHSWELGRVALSRHGELPLWNPYQCGGIPEWGDPQSQLFHPLFFTSFLFGTTLGLKLFVLVHAALGLGGMYWFARAAEGLSRPAASLAALAWAGSGFFAWHVGSGHGGFVAFYLTPYVLLGFRRAVADVRWSALVALVFAAALFAGGVYAFPYLALLIGLDALGQLLAKADRRKLGTALGVSALLALLLSSFRLVPILQHLIWYPRVRAHQDTVSLPELFGSLTHFDRAADLENQSGHLYSRVEYGAYLGAGVLLVALIGAAVTVRARLRLLASALVFGSVCLGDFAGFAPWSLLRRLPVFGSLQVPSRFLFALTFFLALLAGAGLQWVAGRGEKNRWLEPLGRWRAYIPWLLVAGLGLPLVAQHRAVLDGRWRSPEVVPRSGGRFHLVTVAPPGEVAQYPPRAQAPADGVGTGWCYTGMGYAPAPGLWAGAEAQARIEPVGTLHDEGRSIRRLFADVELPLGGRVVMNQTFAPGWRASVGTLVADQRRLAVELPPGRHRVVMSYAPESLSWAAFGSLAGLAGIAVLLRSRERRHRALALAGGVACAVACYAQALRPGPRGDAEPPNVVFVAGASDYAERGLNDWYRPENAVDGVALSEWLAPPGRTAWLELRLDSARPLRHVALDNARNPPHGDYGSREIRVESFHGERRLDTRAAAFSDAPGGRATVTLSGEPVDRLRISIDSWRGVGGGLAEVRVF